MRIEHRVAGADANVYLTVAAILAAALHGIENKLLPPDAIAGDAGESVLGTVQQLPRFWGDALHAIRAVRVYWGLSGRGVSDCLCPEQASGKSRV